MRTQISIRGFSRHEVEAGLSALRAEFEQRPWLVKVKAYWDDDRGRLVVAVEYKTDSPVERVYTAATLDEVWDCVIACMHFESEGIHFDVD